MQGGWSIIIYGAMNRRGNSNAAPSFLFISFVYFMWFQNAIKYYTACSLMWMNVCVAIE